MISGRALPVEDLGRELLRLAEIDEIGRHGLVFREALEVGQDRTHSRQLDTCEKLGRRLAGWSQ